ncbi:hypothetical protein STEG23_022875, partial [Scotinomys teguina]
IGTEGFLTGSMYYLCLETETSSRYFFEDSTNQAISTEDENLWIASRLIWFDQPRPPDRSSDVPTSRSASRQLAQKMKPHRLLQSGLDHNPKVFFVSPLRTQRPLYLKNNTMTPLLKCKDKGGFSSKLRVESLIE